MTAILSSGKCARGGAGRFIGPRISKRFGLVGPWYSFP